MLRTTVVAVTDTADLDLRAPTVADGPALWRLAANSPALDVNSAYAYLLWCRDFAQTSVIATLDGSPVGFVTGYRRPDQPDTLMLWQVLVAAAHRGAGTAGRMIDHMVRRLHPDGVTHLEASVTPGNLASQRLFEAFARRWRARLERSELFGTDLFPDQHASEILFRIGPLRVPQQR
ncbi:diaminobutyrate acetyltransferase [Mycobacterium sp.]|uniref:diaminobutyrate acetyltransferase n=1 Tax=Mycobacterium sp. TaxID=1785 RepID=UPI001271943E|nr:diaminobutyrate acetyltransferase [Mycobacterium sp.]KAA8967737.1 MAG: diaminobutyrate acetyltransferase [Mycobacterium sp.]